MDIAVWSLVETMFMIFCSTLPTLRPWLSLLISKVTNTNPSTDRTKHGTEVTFRQVSKRHHVEGARRNSAVSHLLSSSPSAEGIELPPVTADPRPPEKAHIAFLQVPAKEGLDT